MANSWAEEVKWNFQADREGLRWELERSRQLNMDEETGAKTRLRWTGPVLLC